MTPPWKPATMISYNGLLTYTRCTQQSILYAKDIVVSRTDAEWREKRHISIRAEQEVRRRATPCAV